MYFKYKDISNLLATSEANSKVSFGLYPNPAPNRQVTLLYDVKNGVEKKGNISIYDFSGKLVQQTEIAKTQGFFKKDLDLSRVQSGVYLVKLTVGSYTETKKLVLK